MKQFSLFLSLLLDKTLFPQKNRGALSIAAKPVYQPKPKHPHGRGKKGRGW
jgi:hypothetical protein